MRAAPVDPMRWWTLVVALALTAATTLAPAASARPCEGTTVAIDVGTETFYVDDTGHDGSERYQAVYMESNDQGGLQRGGEGVVSGDRFPWLFIGVCVDSATPDARVYP